MEMKIEYQDGIGIISITGELDAQTAPALTGFFKDHANKGNGTFVADLRGLAYSSSAGIRVFLGMARESRQQMGDLRIAAPQPQVEKIFTLSKFDKIVRVFPTVEEALNSYKNEA